MEPEASTSYLPPHPTPSPPCPRTCRRIRRRREEEGGRVDGSPINTRSSNRPPFSNLSSNPRHPRSQPSPSPPAQLFTPSNRGPRSLRSRVLTSMGVLLALPSQTLAFPFLSPRSKSKSQQQQQQPLESQPPAPLPTPPPAAFPSRKGKERETVGAVRRGAGLSKRDSTGKVIPDRYTPAADGSGSWDLDLGWELFGVSPSVQRDLAEEQTSPSSTITATPSSSSQTAASTSSTTTTSITYPRDWENTGNTRDAFELPLIIACTVSLAILVILTVATFIARRNKRSRRSKREKRRATSASRDSTVSVDIAGMKEKALQEEEARLRGSKWKGGVVGVLKSAGGGRKFLRRRKGKKAKVGAPVGDSVVEEEGSQDGRGSTSLDGGERERVSGDGTPAVRLSNEERTDEGNEEPSSSTSPRLSEDRSRSPPPPSTPPLSPLNTLGSPLPTTASSFADPTTSTNLPTSPSTTSLLSISAPAPPSPPPPHSNQTVPPTYRASTMAGASPSAASSSTARRTHLALPSISTVPPLSLSPTTPHGFPVDDKRPFPPSSSSRADDLPPLEPSPFTQHQPSSPSPLPTSNHHHLATDDKSALARLASQASAPDDHPSSSSHDQEGSAPAWRDEDDDDQLPESVLHQSTPSAIPAPPRPWGEKTMEDPYLPPLNLDDAPEPLEVEGTDAPSAPMMDDEEEEEASAPPLEMDEGEEEVERR